jgi:hypothetical protein
MLEARVLPTTKTDLLSALCDFLKNPNRRASLSSIDAKPTPIKASRPTEHIKLSPSLNARQTQGPKAREVFRPTFIGAAASVRRVHLEN